MAKYEKNVTVLFADEVYDPQTMRCIEIGVIAITGSPLQVALICESLRKTDLELLNVEENLKIYEACKTALRDFRHNRVIMK